MLAQQLKKSKINDFKQVKPQLPVKVKQIEKRFVVDRSSSITQDIFREICKEQKKKIITTLRLNRSKLKAFLSQKYKGYIAHRMMSVFDFATNLDYDKYLDMIETLMNFKEQTLFKLAFSLYDFDQDNLICELDLYTLFKTY